MTVNRLRPPADPGLQPERTSLAWLRTFLGYGALLALALRHSWQQSGMVFWLALLITLVVAAVLYDYVRQRHVMNTPGGNYADAATVHVKLLTALAVCGLALLFVVMHLGKIIGLMSGA